MTQTLPDAAIADVQRETRRTATAMTPETVRAILEALDRGLPIERAATIGGISSRTWRYWMQRGREAIAAARERGFEIDAVDVPSFLDDARARERGSELEAWPAFIAVQDRPYVALVTEAPRNFAKGEMALVEKILMLGDAKGDWKAAAHVLACTRPDVWAAQQKVQISGDATNPVQVKAVAPAPANPGEIGETIQALLDSNQIEPEVAQAWGVVAAFLAGPVGEPDPGEES